MNRKISSAGLALAFVIAFVSGPDEARSAPGGVPAGLEAIQLQIQAVQATLNDLQAQLGGAGDGVVLINQDSALAGDITPGDAPGFPVSITQPGSYRLSGNLTAPSGSIGIEISADDVTLDLNGFVISGGGPAATAIRETSARNRIEIAHGAIRDFGDGVNLLNSSHVTVRDLRSTNLSSFSVVVGKFSTIHRNSAQGLIQATCPSVLTENVTEGFITVVSNASTDQCVRWNNRALNFQDPVTQ